MESTQHEMQHTLSFSRTGANHDAFGLGLLRAQSTPKMASAATTNPPNPPTQRPSQEHNGQGEAPHCRVGGWMKNLPVANQPQNLSNQHQAHYLVLDFHTPKQQAADRPFCRGEELGPVCFLIPKWMSEAKATESKANMHRITVRPVWKIAKTERRPQARNPSEKVAYELSWLALRSCAQTPH